MFTLAFTFNFMATINVAWKRYRCNLLICHGFRLQKIIHFVRNHKLINLLVVSCAKLQETNYVIEFGYSYIMERYWIP